MPTSVPNFNFLAPLVTEMWRGSQIKKKLGAADFLRRGQILTYSHSTCKCLPAY